MVVVGVTETSGDAACEFDQPVDGFGSAVVGAAGGEVARERVLPLFQGPARAGDFGARAGGERDDDVFGQLATLGATGSTLGSVPTAPQAYRLTIISFIV